MLNCMMKELSCERMKLQVCQRAIINSAMATEALQIQTCQQVKEFSLNSHILHNT